MNTFQAAEAGGNCALTRPGELHVVDGVSILGYTDFPSRLPTQSSTLYSNNITKFLLSFGGEGRFHIDLEDEVVRGAAITYNGERLPPVPRAMPPPPPATPVAAQAVEIKALTPWQKVSRDVAVITGGMVGTGTLSDISITHV